MFWYTSPSFLFSVITEINSKYLHFQYDYKTNKCVKSYSLSQFENVTVYYFYNKHSSLKIIPPSDSE